MLKLDASNSILVINYCRLTDIIYMGRSSSNGLFLFIYLFLHVFNLHVTLPFDNFTMCVLQTLNIAPSQLHPNTWASLQAFRLMCDMLCLRPTSSTFLHYYTSHSSDQVSWLSLIIRLGNILFSPFTSLYKNFKDKIFKIFIEPEGRALFYELGRSKFSL